MSIDKADREFKLKQKIEKKHPNFAEVVNAMNNGELKQKMSIYARYTVEVKTELKNNEEIERVSNELKELKGPYNDTLKALKEKMDYIYILLKEQEGLLSDG